MLWQLQLFVLLWVAQHVSHTLCGRRARRRRFRLPPSAKQQLPLKLRQQPLLRLRKNAAAQCVLVLARAMCACICSGLWCGVAARLRSCAATPVIVAQLDRLLVAAPQRGAAVVEKGRAVARHASLNGRGERACGQRSCTSAASVLLLAPDQKGRRGQPLLQRGGVALLLHTGVRGTMVGVQARVRLGRKK